MPTTQIDKRSVALRMQQIAEGYADAQIHEIGRNAGEQIEKFLAVTGFEAGAPWCASFCSWCGLKALADRLGRRYNEDTAVAVLKSLKPRLAQDFFLPSASTGAIMRHAQAHERWVPRGHRLEQHLEAPCLVVFNFDADSAPEHIGILTKFREKDCRTVEGNTSSGVRGSQADGDGVFRRVRPYSVVLGYVRFF
jgi:hypothetical protein